MTPRRAREDDDETEERPVFERRTGNKIAIYGMVSAVLVNIVTVVWFAASLQAAVVNIMESNRSRDATLAGLSAQVATIAKEVAVISDRVMREPR